MAPSISRSYPEKYLKLIERYIDSNIFISSKIEKFFVNNFKLQKNNKELIEVGLYISEVASIINELLIYNIDDAIDVNYFDVLIEQRKKFTEKKNVQNN